MKTNIIFFSIIVLILLTLIPLILFQSEIEFSSSLFVTEWLKILYSTFLTIIVVKYLFDYYINNHLPKYQYKNISNDINSKTKEIERILTNIISSNNIENQQKEELAKYITEVFTLILILKEYYNYQLITDISNFSFFQILHDNKIKINQIINTVSSSAYLMRLEEKPQIEYLKQLINKRKL